MYVLKSAVAFIIMGNGQMNKHRQDDRRGAQTNGRMAKADALLLILLLLLGAAGFFAVRLMAQKSGAVVQVSLHGEAYGTYPLTQELSIQIRQNGKVTNVLKISEGKAAMIQADCPDQLCVHQNAIAGQGETIVCLPNQVVVRIEGTQEEGLDSVSR